MATQEIHDFDERSIRKIADSVHRLEAQVRNLRRQRDVRHTTGAVKAVRSGKTTTNAIHPVYPTTGNTFLVQFDDIDFLETPGDQPITYEDWTSKYVVARTYGGVFLAEDTRVVMFRFAGKKGRRWLIIPEAEDAQTSNPDPTSWAIAQKNWKDARCPFVESKATTGCDPATTAIQVWQVEDTPSTFVDETADANSAASADWQIFPTTPAIDDYAAIGHTDTFTKVEFDNAGGTAGTSGVVIWEYSQGAGVWANLFKITDKTVGFTAAVSDGQTLTYDLPSDWAKDSLNGETSQFYIRAQITTNYSINPIYDQVYLFTGTGAVFNVTLPITGDFTPNVIRGDVYAVVKTTSGEITCVSTYLQSKIRTFTQWVGKLIDIPGGWACMDGVANAGPQGSGIDLRAKFIICTCLDSELNTVKGDNTTNAGDTDTATTGITVDDHPITATTLTETGVSILDHPPHYHHVDNILIDTYEDGIETAVKSFTDCTGPPQDSSSCADDITLDHTIFDPPHGHNVPALTHTVNETAHKHTTSPFEIDPEATCVFFIERINNDDS